jgi:branched-chain amino acid transport system substrate-binding protein
MARWATAALASVAMTLGVTACGDEGGVGTTDDEGVTTYRLASLNDYSGAFANRGKPVEGMQQMLINWFNENEGKDLGIKIELETYDTSYDSAKALDAYNKALTVKPLGILSFGSPINAAIMEKTKIDKIPAISGGPTSESIVPGSWLQAPLGEYGDYFAAAVKHLQAQEGGPIDVSFVSFDGVASQGWRKFFKAGIEGSKVTIVNEEYINPTATDVTVNVQRIVASDPDVVVVAATDQLQPLILDGLSRAGFDMGKVVNSQHESLGLLEKLDVAPEVLEGQLEINTQRYQDKTTDAYQIFEEFQDGVETRWAADTLLHFPSTMVLLQAIARASQEVGSDSITPEDVHEQMANGTFDMFGLSSDLTFEDSVGGPSEAYILRYEGGTIAEVAKVGLEE